MLQSCSGALLGARAQLLRENHPTQGFLLLLDELQTSLVCSYLQLGLSSSCAEPLKELAAEPRREAVSSWAGAASKQQGGKRGF